MTAPATTDEAERRRRIRKGALLLTLFAVLIYVGFIVAFVTSRS